MYIASASETARRGGATVVAGDASVEVRDFTVDSRSVGEGGCFVCFHGESRDGNAYAAAALEAGAACVVMTREATAEEAALAEARGACLLRADGDDAEGFLLRLAESWRLEQGWCVVGVTGSVGKTTTKDMLACALAASWRVHSNKGNLNSVIGVPLTVLSAPDDTEVFVCEMGMNHVGEIDAIARCARPHVGCVTNIGTSHIGILGSRGNIARAKAEMVPWLAADRGLASSPHPAPAMALTASDDFTALIGGICEEEGVPTDVVGGRDSAVRAEGVELDGDGCPRLTLVTPQGSSEVHLRLSGRQTVPDLLLAVDLCLRLGMGLDDVVAALEAMEPTHMRTEVVAAARGFRVIDDSYNASPSSMAAALDLLCEMDCDGRRVAVVGEVGELGDEAPRLHGLMGAYLAAKPLDIVCVVGGEMADVMADAALVMGLSDDRLVRVPTAADAARVLGPVLGEGDLVLAKASRSVGLDAFVEEVRA